jgi:hypothetical protein
MRERLGNALALGVLLVLIGITVPIWWTIEQIDAHLASCRPNERWGTNVWHTHRFLLWKWKSAHCESETGGQMTWLRWCWQDWRSQ